jgi:hypothetical protein
MLSSARYRAKKGIRFVYGQLWNAGGNFDAIGRHYGETGKEFASIGWDGAPPLFLAVSLLPKWMGTLVPSADPSTYHFVRLPEGDFDLADDCDFENPKCDYDRICALKSGLVNPIRVGDGIGLTFSSDEPWIWWQAQLTLVASGYMPSVADLESAKWSDELTWEAKESRYVIMNSACYGRELSEQKPDEDYGYFKVRLKPGKYAIQFTSIGENHPWLFRFVLKKRQKKTAATGRKKGFPKSKSAGKRKK